MMIDETTAHENSHRRLRTATVRQTGCTRTALELHQALIDRPSDPQFAGAMRTNSGVTPITSVRNAAQRDVTVVSQISDDHRPTDDAMAIFTRILMRVAAEQYDTEKPTSKAA